jgi:molecular chaperone GrpE
VLQVSQPGYSIGERVLRPAMVGIAKGGPKVAAANGNMPEPGPVDAQAEKDA